MTDTHTTSHIPDEAIHAALLSMAQDNISADVQGLLMHGFDKLNAKPNALRNAIAAALPHLAPCAVEVSDVAVLQRIAGYADQYDVPDENGAWPDIQDAMVTVGDLRALRRILSNVVTKPVDVAAVRRQAFEEGFENGVEQSLNALDAYDDITRNEAEQGIRKLKPDYRALSAEPAQGDHIADVGKMVEAMEETRIDLVVLSGNIADAAKSSDKWEGMYDRVRSWIDRIDAALPAAPTTEAGK